MEIRLLVRESYPNDAGRKVARISEKAMKEIGADVGDYIEVIGRGTTVLQVYKLREGEDENIIRMDGLARKNVGVGIGEWVKVRKVKKIHMASRVVIAPVGQRIIFDEEKMRRYLKNFLYGKPLARNEIVNIPTFIGILPMKVVAIDPGSPAIVVDGTVVDVTRTTVGVEGIPRVTWEDIGDLEEAKEKIREIVELPMKHPELFSRLGIDPPKGVLLYGPPGCGKTLLAKALANEVGAYFIAINGPEIMSKYYGESEARLREIFEDAKKHAPAIIFIDEIDAIAPRREEVTGEVEKRVVAQLLTLMDGLTERGKVIVIAATNRPEAVDPALRRPGRFDREIEIPPPDKRARKLILQVHTRNVPLGDDVDLDRLAELTYGYTGADIAALVKEAAMNALRRYVRAGKITFDGRLDPNILNEIKVTMDDFLSAMKSIQPTLLREIYVEKPPVTLDDVGGYSDVKTQLYESVILPLQNPEIFREMGIGHPRGVLLFGPPGCGKTLMANAVAGSAKANVISVRGPEILSKWVGESEKAIRKIFRRAKQVTPTIIILDEIDAIAPMRGVRPDSGVSDRIVNQLLTEMDSLRFTEGIIVIATTNRPDILDPALIRPGRFDRLVYVPPPDRQSRLEILKLYTKKVPLADDVNLESIADKTNGYSGADLEALVREAVMNALRRSGYKKTKVTMKDFEEAMKTIQPSLANIDTGKYEELIRKRGIYM